MKQALFNIHDMILILVLALCIMQAALNIVSNPSMMKNTTRNLLAAFLVINGFIALDTLIFWGEGTRQAAFNFAPWSATLLSTAMFAYGPILYCLVRSVSPHSNASDFVNKNNLIHLAPILVVPIYLYFVCYQYPLEVQRSLILDLTIYSIPDAHFATFIFLKKTIPLVYGLVSLQILWQQRKHFDLDGYIKPIQPVLYLAFGFTLIRAIELLNHLTSAWLPIAYADTVGILGNYLTLCLVVGFMVLNGQRSLLLQRKAAEIQKIAIEAHKAAIDVQKIAIEVHKTAVEAQKNGADIESVGVENPKKTESDHLELEEIADKITTYMRINQPYLNSQLTLERFSNELSVSQRLVSRTVNQMFDCNFQEFINRYRVEAAKELLKSNDTNKLTMEEIAHKAGFNSKPTFNRLFKNITSSTPSHYKQHYHELSAS